MSLLFLLFWCYGTATAPLNVIDKKQDVGSPRLKLSDSQTTLDDQPGQCLTPHLLDFCKPPINARGATLIWPLHTQRAPCIYLGVGVYTGSIPPLCDFPPKHQSVPVLQASFCKSQQQSVSHSTLQHHLYFAIFLIC